ncbi:MAG: NAD-dependent epimerase/dehydratase family protein, partial [Caldimonas sp.]
MRILVIGGGVFLGAAIIDSALARGHALTVFNRGRARSDWPAGVEAIVGDRSTDLALLQGRGFDAVIDVCGYVPADVRASAAALASCRRYCFVSSISAYASFAHAPVRENDPLAASDAIAEDDRDRAHYGPQKAACERVVAAAFGARALVVRPGLIVGPRDPTGRFGHWPWRALAGGDILVPDVPADEPIQVIDVRDLADWIVRAVEAGASGAYNATGPQDGRACGWPDVLEACIAAARRRGGAPLRF